MKTNPAINTYQYISIEDAVKSIKNLIRLTDNDASRTIDEYPINISDISDSCYKMLLSAATTNRDGSVGLDIKGSYYGLFGDNILEWASKDIPDRRIQWVFTQSDVGIFINSGTGEESIFIGKVFDGINVLRQEISEVTLLIKTSRLEQAESKSVKISKVVDEQQVRDLMNNLGLAMEVEDTDPVLTCDVVFIVVS